jgi:chromosome partitioning protein
MPRKQPNPHPAHSPQIISVAVIKGGTGKTTTAAALAQAAVAAGKKVLAIDLDPQANLSYTIGADLNSPGSYQLLHGTEAAQLIQDTPQGMRAITASPDLATERTTPGSARRLLDAINPIKDEYDFIFIDTPPTMGELTFNALQASTGLLIPLQADNYSLQGLYQITDIAHQMQRRNPALSIIGVILTRYDSRPKINRYFRDAIQAAGEETGAPLIAEIRPGIAICEAQMLCRSVFDYAPRSKPAQDYNDLFKLITGGKHNGK